MVRNGCETSCFTAEVTVTPPRGEAGEEELVGNVAALTEPEKKNIIEKTVIRSSAETEEAFKRLIEL